MTSKELIEAVLAAQADFDAKSAAVAQAVAALQGARAVLEQATAELHDDLAANGPCLYEDVTTDPSQYYVYAATADGFTATPIRLAA